MFKKVIVLAILAVFVLGTGLLYAQDTDYEAYQTELKKLNSQMKQLRDDYKKKMKDIDSTTGAEFQKLDPNDKAGRKALLAKKREEKKKMQMDYRKQQKALRDQVKNLKQDSKGVVKTKGGPKKDK